MFKPEHGFHMIDNRFIFALGDHEGGIQNSVTIGLTYHKDVPDEDREEVSSAILQFLRALYENRED